MKGPNKTKRLKAQRGSADLTLVKFSSLEAPTSTQRDDECASSHGGEGAASWTIGHERGKTFPACPILVSYASDSIIFHIIYLIKRKRNWNFFANDGFFCLWLGFNPIIKLKEGKEGGLVFVGSRLLCL
ncbi:unnamed protein product [Prunus brigantina]